MKKWFFFVVMQVCFGMQLFGHPFHASVCELEYNATNQSYEVSVKFFTDDFTDALRKFSPELPAPDLLNNDEQKRITEYLETYFTFSHGTRNLPYEYIGMEGDEDAVYVYLEIKNIPENKPLVIQYLTLFDLFDDQANIVHYRCGYDTKTYLFRKNEEASPLVCE